MEQIKKLFKELENEISSEKFIKLYETIREKYPPIDSYLTPQDLISHLHNQNKPDYQLNNYLLSSLILEYQTHSESNAIGSYLLILFRPGLIRLFFQFTLRAKQFSSMGELDIWLQIVTLFFEELNQLDLNEDKTKLASKILGRLRNRLRGYFSNLFKEITSERESVLNPEPTSPEPFQITPQEIIPLLDDLTKSGIISETDKYIILASKIYGKSTKIISQELKSLSCEAIRQRKARAQKAIRLYLQHKKF